MPDIFISYNREDRDTARLFASALEAEGLSVWWDAALRAGETYDEVTEQNLRTAGAVVVLWSKRSANSKWVRAEATVGERSSTLVPALIEDCERPIRFELVQTADLRHWRGDRSDPHWRAFMQDVKLAVSRRTARTQPAVASAPAHDASIETAFWNSIKDGKDRAEFEAYLKRYPNGNFAALAQNRLAALARAGAPAQPAAKPQAPTAQQRPPQSHAQPRPASTPSQSAKTAAPPPEKSGNGLLIAGVIIGLGVIGAVGYMLMRGDEASVAAQTPAAIVAAEEPAPAAQEDASPADETGENTADVAIAESAPAQDAILNIEEAPVEDVAAVEAAAPQPDPLAPFRDCDSCPLMAPIAGGVFLMGSPKDEPGRNGYEGPQREVTVKPFAMGVYEVTTGEWSACVDDGACPARRTDETGKMPALGLSWRDASAYASWLTKKTGRKYRLPTEAEWEYAARAGTTSAYWWGSSFDKSRVSAKEAIAVGAYDANAFGLYDVLGNAREWVADCYVNNYANAPVDGSAVVEGDCGRRVVRGGAWSSPPADMRSANRSRIDIGVTASYMGVRMAAELEK